MQPMTELERAVAGLVLAGLVGHVVAGMFVPGLPAWKMFAETDRFEYRLADKDGRPVEIKDHLPANALMIDATIVASFGRWFVLKHPERAPLTGELVLHRGERRLVYDVRADAAGRVEQCLRTEPAPTGKSSSISSGSEPSPPGRSPKGS